jgi:hypothetical protein
VILERSKCPLDIITLSRAVPETEKGAREGENAKIRKTRQAMHV